MNPSSPPQHPYSPSPDGYVRLPEHTLASLRLTHVMSGLDDALLDELRMHSIDTQLAGYTEWQRAHQPGIAHITISWDWYLDRITGAFVIAWGDVRSNVMGINRYGSDIGMTHTSAALSRRLARLNWPNIVITAACGPWDAHRVGSTLQ